MDMRLLLLSLEASKHICGQERSEKSNAFCDEKALHSDKKGTKRPGTDYLLVGQMKGHYSGPICIVL